MSALAGAGAPEYLAGVYRAVSPPALDGKGAAACWRGLPALWYRRLEGDLVENAFVKLLWDDRALYVFVWSEADDMTQRKPVAARSPASIFDDDDCELFIDPGRSQARYYQLATSAGGGLYQAAVDELTLPDKSWRSGATLAVARIQTELERKDKR